MAKVLVTGIRKVDFTDDKGRPVKGTSIYYKKKLETQDGLLGAGYTTDKVWLRDGSDLESKMLRANYDKPIEVDMVFDILPNQRRPSLVDIVF